ncbi:MAG: PolC-type DNA polymerase III [Lachnospiraceae bacterium]|nr:PolC-type DNA polymerase III [Lachnospiraceae bacterium]
MDAFNGLNLTDRQKRIFSEVYVLSVNASKKEQLLTVDISSNHLIEYREIRLLKERLNNSLKSTGFTVFIDENYELSDAYTPEYFWNEYKESVFQKFKEKDVILFNILLTSKIDMEGNTLNLECVNNSINKSRKEDFKTEIIEVFQKIGHYDIDVDMNFTLENKDNYTDPYANMDPYEELGIDRNSIKEDSSNTSEDEGFIGAKDSSEEKKGSGKEAASDSDKSSDKNNNSAAKNTSSAGDNSSNNQSKASGNSGEKRGGFSGNFDSKRFNSFKKKRANEEVDVDCFLGYNVNGDVVKICDITQEERTEKVVEGQAISFEVKESKNGEWNICSLGLSDFTDGLTVKIFIRTEEAEEPVKILTDGAKRGKFFRVKGFPEYDRFSGEVGLNKIKGIKEIADTRQKRKDEYDGMKRVELHAHTQMSENDSVMSVKDYINTAKSWGHTAIAITDHGVVQAFPDAYHAISRDDNLKLIYGMEAYLVDDLVDIAKNSHGESLDSDYVIFDLETTGIGVRNHKIIEIGAVKVKNGEIVDRFSTFVNPEEPIPYEITELTTITDNDVKDKETIDIILPRFLEFCKGCSLVAHNADFDYGFIKHYGTLLGLKVDFTVVDTVGLSRLLLPQLGRFKLDRVAKELKVVLDNHHRAVDDAECTAHIFLKLCERLKKQGVTDLDGVNKLKDGNNNNIRKLRPHHAIILAKNETGRVNLYRLVSESHVKTFYKKPIIAKSLLNQYREGLILGSACSSGELYEAILEDKEPDVIDRIVRYYDYLEVQPLGNNRYLVDNTEKYKNIQDEQDLIDINRKIIKLGEEYQKLVCATCDIHFLNPEDSVYRQIMMAAKKFGDANAQPPIYYRTTEEMLKEFFYLPSDKAYEIVVKNTNIIADMIEDISPLSPRKCPPIIENSDVTLREICERRAKEIYGDKLPPVVRERLDRELNSIIGNGYAVMYIIAQKLVWKSNEDGYLVGSRGSVGSSFAAYTAGITEVNSLAAHYYCPDCHYSEFDSPELKSYVGTSACDIPDKMCPNCGKLLAKDGHDIPFETFLGFKGNKEPDIDLNFSSEYQSNAHDYTEVIFGHGQTYKAGTVSGIQDKTAYGYVKKFCEEEGLDKRSAEMTRLASGMVGTRRTTGQHPGGIVVLPVGEDINTFTPVQHPADKADSPVVTTHFDYHKIDSNLLKLDILGHQDPTMIRELMDLTGVDATKIPLNDKEVLSLFESTEALGITPEDIGGCQLGCLGLPEFGTKFVINMLLEAKPKNFSDLVRISGLSHGTDVWINNAQYYISTGKCTLSSAICTRDDIMIYLISKGIENEKSFTIMESVRKGKGLKPEWEEDMKAHDVPDWYIESCKKIKYMFPKAHAVAYVMMAMRVAYFKVHYPLAYYAAYFSIRATAFDYEKMACGRDKLENYIRDYNKRMNQLSDQEKNTLENMKIVQEMYARGYDFMPIDIYKAKANRFQIVDGKLMPSLLSIEGLGDKAAEMFEAEAEKGKFLSREDISKRAKVPQTVLDKMDELNLLYSLPKSNQISIFDI